MVRTRFGALVRVRLATGGQDVRTALSAVQVPALVGRDNGNAHIACPERHFLPRLAQGNGTHDGPRQWVHHANGKREGLGPFYTGVRVIVAGYPVQLVPVVWRSNVNGVRQSQLPVNR